MTGVNMRKTLRLCVALIGAVLGMIVGFIGAYLLGFHEHQDVFTPAIVLGAGLSGLAIHFSKRLTRQASARTIGIAGVLAVLGATAALFAFLKIFIFH